MDFNINFNMIFKRFLLLSAVTACCVCWFAAVGRANPTYNREALEATQRIAILSPFFITEDAKKVAAPQQSAPKLLKSSQVFTRQAHYALAKTMQGMLPGFLAESGRFLIVPTSQTQQALYTLHWQARDLFLPLDRKHKSHFPIPDTKRIQQLARQMHVDAILLGTMREPASIAEGLRLPYEIWLVDPLHISARHKPAHVLSPRVQASLITTEGVVAWQDEQMADHPRSLPHTPRTLLVDWEEATEQAAQQLADSLVDCVRKSENARLIKRGRGRSRTLFRTSP